MTVPIEDYALIGDCKTAALVSRDGSIDWLCWPRFDSAACFTALLGTADNGRWLIAPKHPPLAVSRHYRAGTLVLETEFQTETGRAAIIDFMPPRIAQIIEGPARVAGLSVDDAFVQQAVRDAETADALPLLAFALRELYDRASQGHYLSLAAYNAQLFAKYQLDKFGSRGLSSIDFPRNSMAFPYWPIST